MTTLDATLLAACGFGVAVYLLAIALSLVERRREARRMHQARKDSTMEFGVVNGPRFQRCATCGHVRHG